VQAAHRRRTVRSSSDAVYSRNLISWPAPSAARPTHATHARRVDFEGPAYGYPPRRASKCATHLKHSLSADMSGGGNNNKDGWVPNPFELA
jgi:hypothetical protein